jgi:hypothetical protein
MEEERFMRTNARMLFLLAFLALSDGVANAAAISSVEAMSSTVMQRHQSSFSGIGLRARVKLPQLIEGFSVMPAMEYWRNKSTIKDFGITSTRKDASLVGFFRYDFKREGWQPYGGVGLGVHFMSSEVDAPSLGLNDASESIIKGGIGLLGGVSFGLSGRLGNLIELEYHQLSQESQFKFNWGLSYSL